MAAPASKKFNISAAFFAVSSSSIVLPHQPHLLPSQAYGDVP